MIIKVCGLREADNIRDIERLPADWMGFIFYPPSPRYVARVPAYLPQHRKRVGVFVNADKDFILQHISLFALDFVQLHGDETPVFCTEIRNTAHVGIIKAFAVSQHTDFDTLQGYEGCADYFLFDTPCASAGGCGRTFNHSLLSRYHGHTPFLLSGGLGPGDEAEILRFSHPAFAGIDLNSRFELSPAVKSVARLQTFLSNLTTNTTSL